MNALALSPCLTFLIISLFSIVVSTSAFSIQGRIPSFTGQDVSCRHHGLFGLSTSSTSMESNVSTPQMIQSMTSFLVDMIDVDSKRFYASSFPPRAVRQHDHNPIRDLAAAWDATKALLWLQEQHIPIPAPQEELLKQAIYNTIVSYKVVPWDESDTLVMDSDHLQEPSNIAHSAIMILATIGAVNLSIFSNSDPPFSIEGLVKGILAMQRPEDGAFCISFGDNKDNNVYQGIEFYPGEAMVALLEVYTQPSILVSDSTRQKILVAMERAFGFYSNYYSQGNTDVNYNIWQIQAFARLYQVLKNDSIREYVLEMCMGVLQSKSWKYELARGASFYSNLDTIEIACGLDALADGMVHVAQEQHEDDDRLFELQKHTLKAVDFLEWSQDQVPLDGFGRGGLGFGGVLVLEQRLDVTGHAISALTKLPLGL